MKSVEARTVIPRGGIRMGLFAESVELYHPLKEDNLIVECDLPNDLNRLYMEGLR